MDWLRKLKESKLLFLMTSSNADYAKFILNQIFKDENDQQLDYWDFFDICIGDARNCYYLLTVATKKVTPQKLSLFLGNYGQK